MCDVGTYISIMKEIAEAVTAISAAWIVVSKAVKLLPRPIKHFFVKTLPVFFCGTINESGQRVRFLKALKEKKAQEEQQRNIIQALALDFDTEEILVFNTRELSNFLLESKVVTKVSRRKQ